ncbi:unnamed protein product [Rotaria sp. Silwood1]|nr:unnamed protein product [Rotaria sp. Silwood1]
MTTCSNFVPGQWIPEQCCECFQGKEKHVGIQAPTATIDMPIVTDCIQLSKRASQPHEPTKQASSIGYRAPIISRDRSFSAAAGDNAKAFQSSHDNVTRKLSDVQLSKSQTDHIMANQSSKAGSTTYDDIEPKTRSTDESRFQEIQVPRSSILSSITHSSISPSDENTFKNEHEQQPTTSFYNLDSIQGSIPDHVKKSCFQSNDRSTIASSITSVSIEIGAHSTIEKKLVQQQTLTSSMTSNDLQRAVFSTEKTTLGEENEKQTMVSFNTSNVVEKSTPSTDQNMFTNKHEEQQMANTIIINGVKLGTSSPEQSRFRQANVYGSCITSKDFESKISSSDQITSKEENHLQSVDNCVTSNDRQLITHSVDKNRVGQQLDQPPITISTASGTIQSSTNLWRIIDVEETKIPDLKRLDKLLSKLQEQSINDDDLENDTDVLISIFDSLCKKHYTLFETVDIEKRKLFLKSISSRLILGGKVLKTVLPSEKWKTLTKRARLLESLCKFNFDEKPLMFAVQALKYKKIATDLDERLIGLIDEMRLEYPTILDNILAEEYKEIKKKRAKIIIAVFGSTKSSKSSFVNFLLQVEVCPTGNQAATARLTKITYGSRLRLSLTSSTGIEKETTVFNDTRELLQKAKELIILKNDARKSKLCEDIVEIELPISELKNVELWDTPGFDENMIIDERVKIILKDTDLALFVIPQQDSLRQTTIDFIKPYLKQNDTMDDESKRKPITKICFIIGQIDKHKPDAQSEESKYTFLKQIEDKIRRELEINFHNTDDKLSNQLIPMCTSHLHSVEDYLECREQFIKKSNQWFHDAVRDEAYHHLNKLLRSIKEFSNYDNIFRQQARYKRMETIFDEQFSTFSERLKIDVNDKLDEVYSTLKKSIDQLVQECLVMYKHSEKFGKIEQYIRSELIKKFDEILEVKNPEMLEMIEKMFIKFSNPIELKRPDIQILKQVLDDVFKNDSYQYIIEKYQHTSPYDLSTYLKGMYRSLANMLFTTTKIKLGDCSESRETCQRLVKREKFVEENTINSITNLINDVRNNISDNLSNKVKKMLNELLYKHLIQIHKKIEEKAKKYICSSVTKKTMDSLDLFCNKHSMEIKRIHLDILDKEFTLQYSTTLTVNENERLDHKSNFRVFTGTLGEKTSRIAAKLIPLNDFKLQEVLYMHELKHKNIISYYGVKKKTEDQYYIIMPCLDCNLVTYLTENSKRFTSDAIDQMITQIVEGLNYIHTQLELVHRDIKLQNILVNKPKTLFLIADLGGVHIEPLTHLGTAGYMAPELFSADNVPLITQKCDVYSLGIVIQQIIRLADIEQQDDTLIIGWTRISKRCVLNEPSKRPTCEKILQMRLKNND